MIGTWIDRQDMVPETPGVLGPGESFQMATLLLPNDAGEDGLYPYVRDPRGRFIVGPVVEPARIVEFIEKSGALEELGPISVPDPSPRET
jgi:hypothetical protein